MLSEFLFKNIWSSISISQSQHLLCLYEEGNHNTLTIYLIPHSTFLMSMFYIYRLCCATAVVNTIRCCGYVVGYWRLVGPPWEERVSAAGSQQRQGQAGGAVWQSQRVSIWHTHLVHSGTVNILDKKALLTRRLMYWYPDQTRPYSSAVLCCFYETNKCNVL